MNILAITHRTPLPPNKGDRIRSFNLLSRLAREHEIWLGCVDDSGTEEQTHAGLAGFCEAHAVFRLSPLRRYAGAAHSLLAREPLTLGWFHHPMLGHQLRAWANAVRFDVAYVCSSSMAPYWLALRAQSGLPAVMDFIDVDSEKWAQVARYTHSPMRLIYAREHHRLAAFERATAQAAFCSVFVSEAEVAIFQAKVAPGLPAEALSVGADEGYFTRPQIVRKADPPRMVFVGAMDHEPNVDAVVHFANDILPLVRLQLPTAQFVVVGAHPSARVKALASRPGIRVTGWVEDARTYLWEASVAVVPMRVAQGTQTKVIEAMAASLPVVASSLATRGLGEPRGPHVRVADDARSFASAVVELIVDPQSARAQADAGVDMVRRFHSWEASARQLAALLERAAASRSAGVAQGAP
jgi:sugar transferase (PEP-CTERM/EpsH1 system associated)